MNFSKAYETSKLPEEEQSEVIQDKHLLSNDVRAMVKERKEPKISFVEETPEPEEESVSVEFHIGEEIQQDSEEDDSQDNVLEEPSKKDILMQEIRKYRDFLIVETNNVRKKKYQVLYDALVCYKNMLYPPTKE